MRYDAVLALLGDASIVYVDCGARAGSAPAWLRPAKTSRYVGIEADAAECRRLQERGKDRHLYINAVLGRSSETRTLYVTRNPSCSSLLHPNAPVLAPFGEMRDFFVVEREVAVSTIPLDEALEAHGIDSPDFLELDVQGAELDVLEGAERILRESVLGLQVEVEFAEMYERQPLFGDIDRFLRERGFRLFDLARYHVRRGDLQSAMVTNGQLLWGHATYLRAHELYGSPDLLRRLAVVAALIGVPDLSVEILGVLMGRPGGDDETTAALVRAREELLGSGGRRVWRE